MPFNRNLLRQMLLYLLCQVFFSCNSIAFGQESSFFEKTIKEFKRSDVYERTTRMKDDRTFTIANIVSDEDNTYDNQYLIKMEKFRFMLWKFKVYKWVNNKSSLKLLYQDPNYNTVLLNIIPIKNGFIIENRGGIGRKKQYLVFIERNGKLNLILNRSYDFLELAYFRKYNGMPHLFGTNCNFPENLSEKISDFRFYNHTDVFEWNMAEFEYKKIRTFQYDQKNRFKDRFNIKQNESPIFNPSRYF